MAWLKRLSLTYVAEHHWNFTRTSVAFPSSLCAAFLPHQTRLPQLGISGTSLFLCIHSEFASYRLEISLSFSLLSPLLPPNSSSWVSEPFACKVGTVLIHLPPSRKAKWSPSGSLWSLRSPLLAHPAERCLCSARFLPLPPLNASWCSLAVAMSIHSSPVSHLPPRG